MNFIGQSQPLSQQGVDAATQLLGVGPAEVWTVLSVETKGCGYFQNRQPAILFERHIFHQQTGGIYDASHPAISNSASGGYLGGQKEYARLQEAMTLNSHAALNSASWGIGQVMGFNSALAGFSSVENMVTAMVDHEDAQISAFANFLKSRKLHVAMAGHDWAAFAHGYNGPNYAENHYDTRLAAAYASLTSGGVPNLMIRETQLLLTFLGISPAGVDGIPGKMTLSAVAQFNQQHGRGSSTVIDDALIAALRTALQSMSQSA